MPVSFTRRSKVLLALVASMTLGSGLLLGLAPDPIPRNRAIPLTATSDAVPSDFQPSNAPLRSTWDRIVVSASADRTTTLAKLDEDGIKKRLGGCPYHFLVHDDGSVERSSRWHSQGLDPDQSNDIQIRLIGPRDSRRPATEAQLKAKDQLVSWLIGQTGIRPEKVYYR